MLPTPENFMIYPSVVPSDETSQMTILATELAFLPFEGATYSLTIIPVCSDENYYHPENHVKLELVGEGGALKFSHTFSGEGEHLLLLSKDEKPIGEMHVYSLGADLYGLLPLRGDLHGHSYRSDGRRDPAALAGHYREMGYDFFALTDHNRYYSGGEIDEVYGGLDLGITRVRGEEIHSPGSVVHIVHIGGRESVAERYTEAESRAAYDEAVEDYISRLPESIPEKYRERYGKAMWATDAIHAAGGIAILPHPCWRAGASRSYNLPDELTALLLKSGKFDAFEVIGGIAQVDCNRQVALWGDLRAEGCNIPIVGSSDVHAIARVENYPNHFTVCFAKANENDAICEAIKGGLSVAVEAIGEDYGRRYFCYGSLRLVTYAHFLLRYYFPKTQRLSAGEGVAMRAYAVGELSAETLTHSARICRDFSARYFGRLAPAMPSDEMIDFENRWRERQLRGPRTKGSAVDSATINRQI